MKVKTFEEAEKLFDSLSKKRTARANELKEKISAAESEMEKASIAYTEAVSNEDVNTLVKSASEQRAAKDIKEMFQHKLDALMSAPVVDEKEYSELQAALRAIIEEKNTTGKKQVMKLVNEIEKIGSAVSDDIKRANALLHRLQHDLFNDPAELTCANGNKVHIDTLENKYRDYSLVSYINNQLASSAYADCIKGVE